MVSRIDGRAALRAAALASLFVLPASAQSIEVEFVASGLQNPTSLAIPPQSKDLYVCEQHTGRVRIVRSGSILSTPFLSLQGQVAQSAEQGLLGIAFPPDYASNGHVYVSFTDTSGASVLRRYTRQAGNPDQVDGGSGVNVFGPLPQPSGDHNGGCIQFGNDGKLYLGLGDGGECCEDPSGRAQDLAQPYGKVLRFDVDKPFPHVPDDNPFAGQAGLVEHVWALGLRNPWRFSFDSKTGDLWLADVGSSSREEIDFVPAGAQAPANFGWNCMEGTLCKSAGACACNAPSLTLPVHEYTTHSSGNCAVMGGVVYRGGRIPDLYGRYLFADICSGRFWSLGRDAAGNVDVLEHTSDVVPAGGWSVTSFGEAGDGTVYLLDGFGGRVWRLEEEPGTVAAFGCGVNPTGSLTVLSGVPQVGGSVTVGVDAPVGVQAPGSLPILALAVGVLPTYPCGVQVDGWGMGSAWSPGELLIDPTATLPFPIFGPTWTGPGNPAPIVLPFPQDPTLAGGIVYLQAFLFDVNLTDNGKDWLGTTEALQLSIAP